MASAREMRLRIRSVENIAQVTRALQAVSASRVRKAEARVQETRPYAEKAWQVLRHLSHQPVSEQVHPFLAIPLEVKKILVVLISGDRGLAGAYNTNVMRYTLETFRNAEVPVSYLAVGRKGRDLLIRQRLDVTAEFSDLPAEPTFADVSAIGRLAMDEFVGGRADQVYLVYTDFVSLLRQIPRRKLLLPVSFEEIRIGRNEQIVQADQEIKEGPEASYIYEPSQEALINMIVPRLTELQVYQAITESLASEHAARMVAMQNATDNAVELSTALRLEYNKARQKAITSDMLDIAGGAEALRRD
ncbi:MAG: ATP synthase F1 subunit gamma [Anaerolineales bacterium]|jgi:F-type H+-transporting ATPase subunit gamma|nr:ATP synthase F1 subunit gamma [Anaerolineales bacterium]